MRLRDGSGLVLALGAMLGIAGCQAQAPVLTVGQPHAIVVERDGDAQPTVQVGIPAITSGASSLVLERDGATVATVTSIAAASPSAWLPGGTDLWDRDAPYAPSLDYRVVASSGAATVVQDVPVSILRTLTAFPQITSPVDGSRQQGSQPTILWTPVGVPEANPADGFRVDAWYVDNPSIPEISYLFGPDEDRFDWADPATSSTGQEIVPAPLTAGVPVEIQVVAIATSSTETDENVSKPVTFVP